MRHSSARFLVALVCALGIASPVAASTGRLAGLGLPGDYLDDFTATRTYLSGVVSARDLVWVNPSEDAGMGAMLHGTLGAFAVNLNRHAMGLGGSAAGDFDPSSLPPSPVNLSGESLDLTWGHVLAGGAFGLRVRRSHQSDEAAGTVGGSDSWNLLEWGAGLGWRLGSKADAEVSGFLQRRTFENDTYTDDGGRGHLLAARIRTRMSPRLTVTTAARLYAIDLSILHREVAALGRVDRLAGWTAGCAGDWRLAEDDHLVLGVEFSNHRREDASSAQENAQLPRLFMGLESGFTNWCTLRFGAGNAIWPRAEQYGGEVRRSSRWYGTSGIGLHQGRWTLDASIEASSFDGLVGQVLNGVPFQHVSATYSF